MAPRFRHSAFLRLALVYAGSFALSAGLMVALLYTSLVHYLESQNRDQIASELRRLTLAQGIVEIQDLVKLAIDGQAGQPASSFLYFLGDIEGRCAFVVTSSTGACAVASISSWTTVPIKEPGWVETRFELPSGGSLPVLARVQSLRAGFQLMVARPMELQEAFMTEFARLSGVALLGAVAIGVVVAWIVSRRFMARIDRINAACAAVGQAGLQARLPQPTRDDEFALLVRNINSMLDRVQELVQVLSGFAEQVAHDFRTPLTRLRAELSRLPRTHCHQEDPNRRAIADIDRILRSFEQILSVARAEAAGVVTFESVRLDALLEDLAEIYRPVAEEAGHGFAVEIAPATILGRPPLVQQMVANLLDNAIKYTPAPGRVRLALSADSSEARLVVSDNGPGIPKEQRDKALLPFVRLGQNRTIPGTGFGLGFANAVARSHGFTLELRDNDPGLQVIVRMPLAGRS